MRLGKRPQYKSKEWQYGIALERNPAVFRGLWVFSIYCFKINPDFTPDYGAMISDDEFSRGFYLSVDISLPYIEYYPKRGKIFSPRLTRARK